MNKKFDLFEIILISVTVFTIGLVLGKLDAGINKINFDLSSITSSFISLLGLFITYEALKIAHKGLETWKKQRTRELIPKLYYSILNIDSYFNTLDFSEAKLAIEGNIIFFAKINSFLGKEIVNIQTNLLDYEKFIGENPNINVIKESLVNIRHAYISYKEIVTKNSALITQYELQGLKQSQNPKSYESETSELHSSVMKLLRDLDPEIDNMVRNVKKLFD
ncbi:hypothetical protein [Frederiksenia canicola]|uniref:Uncharacterized protein n=1 Tax=Frederiksenia canicola TaxID=123824 RepID=A0AAE7C1S7_9PAST|nr:hypothetical protein [Frederiksenia canicola]QIM64651.1 hypothetical protein A4G17_03980 [Frederiksenia canicola]RPE91142.1 hypothetical protein EDC49_1856 [Frederiksenia canicola]